MNSPATEAAIAAVAALDDPQRGRLYDAVRAARRPVTREEAARSVDISRKLAAFHLDKLVACGLLEVVADPPPAPRKVGRLPKRYRPVEQAVRVSVPARSFERLAGILVDAAVSETSHDSPDESRSRVAKAHGRRQGAAVERGERRGRLGPERALAATESALEAEGFEPYRSGAASLRLANCPFHPLAQQQPTLVCGLNAAYLSGFLEGIGADSLTAALAPREGECCVEIRSGA